MRPDWKSYFDRTASRGRSRLLEKALKYEGRRGQALDLGAGLLQESLALLGAGFRHVVALDSSPVSALRARSLANPGIEHVPLGFGAYQIPPSAFDFVHARNSLFFCEKLEALLCQIEAGLRPGGLFVADFLGSNDSWKGVNGVRCLAAGDLRALLGPWETLFFFDTEFDEPAADGRDKHWHYLKVIARKPG